jgi:hypothetical protein
MSAIAAIILGVTTAIQLIRASSDIKSPITGASPQSPASTSQPGGTSPPSPGAELPPNVLPAPASTVYSLARTHQLLDKCTKPDPVNHTVGWTEDTRAYTGFRVKVDGRWENILVGQFINGALRGVYILCEPYGTYTFGGSAVKNHAYAYEPIDGPRYVGVVKLVTVEPPGGREQAVVMHDGIWFSPTEGRIRGYDATANVIYDSDHRTGSGEGCIVSPDGKTLLDNYESNPPATLSDCRRAFPWPPQQ